MLTVVLLLLLNEASGQTCHGQCHAYEGWKCADGYNCKKPSANSYWNWGCCTEIPITGAPNTPHSHTPHSHTAHQNGDKVSAELCGRCRCTTTIIMAGVEENQFQSDWDQEMESRESHDCELLIEDETIQNCNGFTYFLWRIRWRFSSPTRYEFQNWGNDDYREKWETMCEEIQGGSPSKWATYAPNPPRVDTVGNIITKPPKNTPTTPPTKPPTKPSWWTTGQQVSPASRESPFC